MVLPYAFDTNDMRFTIMAALSETILLIIVLMPLTGFIKRSFRAKNAIYSLHTRIIGKPARIDGLEN